VSREPRSNKGGRSRKRGSSYLTIWNVDRHPDLDLVIFPQDLGSTDDRREPWSVFHAGVRVYHGNWMGEKPCPLVPSVAVLIHHGFKPVPPTPPESAVVPRRNFRLKSAPS
jgi:hypothetical protein